MIQTQTVLKVADNSGVKTVKCFKILGGYNKKIAKLGNIVIVSVQKLLNKYKKTSKIKKGDVYQALIVKTKQGSYKKDGSCTILNENSTVLLDKQNNPISTRILSILPRMFNSKKFQKFVSISKGAV